MVLDGDNVAAVLLWVRAEVTVVTIPPGRVIGATDRLIQTSSLQEKTSEEVVAGALLDTVAVIPTPALRLRQRRPVHEDDNEVTVASVVGSDVGFNGAGGAG